MKIYKDLKKYCELFRSSKFFERTKKIGLTLLLLLSMGMFTDSTGAELICTTEQITDTTSGDSFGTSINSDGDIITFYSSSDLTGDNTDGNLEILLFDTSSNVFTQVTETTMGGSTVPAISSDGNRIVFNSSSDLTGNNGDGNMEVFLFDKTADIFTQITDTAGESFNFSNALNSDGTRIALGSAADIAGTGDSGNSEIFLYDINSEFFSQITESTAGDSVFPAMSSDGTIITFNSESDLTGQNPDGNDEIFSVVCLKDTDEDGVADANDACSGSDLSETVEIDGCDSGVTNELEDNGCTISDTIQDIGETASNHGQFASNVSHFTNDLKKDGIISGRDKGSIQDCASDADIP